MIIDSLRDGAIGVIQCAGSKRPDAGYLLADDGCKVLFVADPAGVPQAPSTTPALRYASPDEATPVGHSYRERLERYNCNDRTDNPWRLLPAWRLYKPGAYRTLVDALGLDNVFILSAGWGLVSADYLLPNYDITFSSNADPYKRRRYGDTQYQDFSMLPQDTTKHVFFFGGLGYLRLFCALTANIRQRTAFVNSNRLPSGVDCRTKRYDTAKKTNWHYECVNAFAAALHGEG